MIWPCLDSFSVKATVQIFEEFYRYAGLKLNKELYFLVHSNSFQLKDKSIGLQWLSNHKKAPTILDVIRILVVSWLSQIFNHQFTSPANNLATALHLMPLPCGMVYLMIFEQPPLWPHSEEGSIPSIAPSIYSIVFCGAWPLLCPWTWILNYVFVHCALESVLWWIFSAIKAELELQWASESFKTLSTWFSPNPDEAVPLSAMAKLNQITVILKSW